VLVSGFLHIALPHQTARQRRHLGTYSDPLSEAVSGCGIWRTRNRLAALANHSRVAPDQAWACAPLTIWPLGVRGNRGADGSANTLRLGAERRQTADEGWQFHMENSGPYQEIGALCVCFKYFCPLVLFLLSLQCLLFERCLLRFLLVTYLSLVRHPIARFYYLVTLLIASSFLQSQS
jgi:hypothetical protein